MGLFSKKYTFDPALYPGEFFAEHTCTEPFQAGPVDHRVYCFWTGDNEMPPARAEALETMRAAIDSSLTLVTPAELPDYILSDHPLHPAFRYLSCNHRSDYLRCYFMHHHGGGYADIKRYRKSWEKAFRELEASDKWLLGYGEVGKRGVARVGGVVQEDLARHWKLLLGNGAFICRPGSPFTTEWYEELHRRMDKYHEALRENPGNTFGDNEGYPIPWTNMQGDIFHPLCLKYHERLARADRIKPSFKNYR